MIKKYSTMIHVIFTTISMGSDVSKNTSSLLGQSKDDGYILDESSTTVTPRTSAITNIKNLEADLIKEFKEKKIEDSELQESLNTYFIKNFYALFHKAKIHLPPYLLEMFMIYQMLKCQLNFDIHIAPPNKAPCADLIRRSLYHLQLTENQFFTPTIRHHSNELRIFLNNYLHPIPSRKASSKNYAKQR